MGTLNQTTTGATARPHNDQPPAERAVHMQHGRGHEHAQPGPAATAPTHSGGICSRMEQCWNLKLN